MTYLIQDNDFPEQTDQLEMREMQEMMMVSPRKNKADYSSHMSCVKGTSGHYGGAPHFWGVVTWLMFMALLIAATRYLWNKGGEKK